jgi:polysaccharide biosynthesis protein PelA
VAKVPEIIKQSFAEAAAKATGSLEEPGGGDSGGGAGWWNLQLLRRRFLRVCGPLLATALAGTTGFGSMGGTARAAGPILPHNQDGRPKWLAFYGQTGDEAALAAYDLIVLDPMFQGSLAQVGAGGARLCAYLSLSEIRRADPFFGNLDVACLLEENPAWPGTYRIDVRQAAWKQLVLHEMMPAIIARGFTGLMLDTLDTPPWLEQIDPIANRGMRQASIDLVRAIRRVSPDMFVIVNRGYAILPDLLRMVDAVLAESLLTMPDPDGNGFRWNSPGDVVTQLALLAPAREFTPPLPILSLDYWDPADTDGIKKIYRRQRALGHLPYVATPLLGEITPEPIG